jgi:hypothetical protein
MPPLALGRETELLVRTIAIAAALLLMALGAPPGAQADESASIPHDTISSDGISAELTERKAQMEEIHQRILAGDFVGLDSTERSWRMGKTRTPTGVWKLEMFYDSMFFLGQMAPAPDCTDSADAVLARWRHASPNSPAPYIASAQRLLAKGWCLRGAGYASSVDDAAWKPFNDNVEAAYDMLSKHEAVASVDPHYYAVMASIYVAQGRSEAKFRALLKEAVAKEPYYYPLYDQAFRYYQPQWFGDYASEEAIARLAVDQTRAKDRSSVVARIYWTQMECGCMPAAEDLDRPGLIQGMADLAELYPNPWNLSHMARMACAIGDYDLAKHYFEALPVGDDGKSGWADWAKVDISSWQGCRNTAGLPAFDDRVQ